MPNEVAWNASQIISSLCNVAVTCKKKIFIWFLLNQAICSRAMTCVGLRGYGIEAQIPFSQTPEMHVWIEPVLNDSFGRLSNLQPPNLIVELKDYQHVHVMPNIPSPCHAKEHTGKVTIRIKSGLH